MNESQLKKIYKMYPKSSNRAAGLLNRFTKALLILCLFALACRVSAQTFKNLGFDSGILIPVAGDPYGRVEFAAALPGWTGYCSNNAQTVASYNNMFLDSAGVSILDGNFRYGESWRGLIQGRYCVLIQSGYSRELYPSVTPVPTAIAQTGTVPANAKTIVFRTSRLQSITNLVLTFNGVPITFWERYEQSNFMVLAGDVTRFAGQTGELRFTAPVLWRQWVDPPCLCPNWSIVVLDSISFSDCYASYFEGFTAQPTNQVVTLGDSVRFVVQAIACPSPSYQWYREGAVIPGATASSYQIANAQATDSGTYWVVLTGSGWGTRTSTMALLTVLGEPISTSPPSQTAETLDSAISRMRGVEPLVIDFFSKNEPVARPRAQLTNVRRAPRR